MVKAANHISNNPQIIVNGFMKAGISKALDGIEESESEDASAHDNKGMSSLVVALMTTTTLVMIWHPIQQSLIKVILSKVMKTVTL